VIYYPVEQRTPEWEALRIGLPTASGMGRIVTPKTLKPSSQRTDYMHQILAEWLLGHAIEFGARSAYMERGTEMEDEARAWYEMHHDVEVTAGGFCTTDDGRAGCSPDGLVDPDGGLEIKCPAIHTHIGYLLDPQTLVDEYRAQVQASLWITERQWWDVLSYSPTLPAVLVRVLPDLAWHDAVEAGLAAFSKELEAAKARLAPHRDARIAQDRAVQDALMAQEMMV
jgi:hypothetical protein